MLGFRPDDEGGQDPYQTQFQENKDPYQIQQRCANLPDRPPWEQPPSPEPQQPIQAPLVLNLEHSKVIMEPGALPAPSNSSSTSWTQQHSQQQPEGAACVEQIIASMRQQHAFL